MGLVHPGNRLVLVINVLKLLLVEIAVILMIVDGIFCIIGSMFGFSWKKVLMTAAAIFGILWLRDFLL